MDRVDPSPRRHTYDATAGAFAFDPRYSPADFRCFVSAETGLNAHKVFDAIEKAAEQHRRRVSTSVMNEVLEDAVRWQKPPSTTTGRQGAVYYCAQVASRPPTTVVFCNDPELFGDSYRRYLEKHVRAALGFQGTPIRLVFRARTRRDS